MTRLPSQFLLVPLVFSAAVGLLFADTSSDITFNYQIGSALPSSQYLSITSQSSTQITNLAIHTSGQAWILAALSSTTTPATLTVAVNPVGMAAGSYFGTIVVTSSATNTLQINVYLTVSQAVSLTAIPPSLSFNSVQGGPAPAMQSLQVGSSAPGTAVFSNAQIPSWLNLNNWIGVGTAPVVIQISVNPSGLAPGTYSTSVRFYTLSDNGGVTVPITLVLTAPPPVLRTSTSQLQFQYIAGGAAPSVQSINVDSSGIPLSASISSSVSWLSTSTLTGTTPFNVDVRVNPTGLAIGAYKGQVVITTTLFNSPSTQTVNVSLSVVPDERPVITSVLNAASFKPAMGPGTWISVGGTNFAKTVAQATSTFLPLSLNGVSAQLRCLNGIQAGLYDLLVDYAGPTQINAFVPHELAPWFFNTSCDIVVVAPTGTASFSIKCQGLAAALFSYGTEHYAAALQTDYTIVGTIPGTRPAQAGSILSLYGTGFGQTTPAVSNVNGVVTPRVLASDIVILIDGQPVKVLWAGMVGIGLYQFNIQLPDVLASGDYPLTVQIGGIETEKVMLPVR